MTVYVAKEGFSFPPIGGGYQRDSEEFGQRSVVSRIVKIRKIVR
jgi:hypothetical protein